MKISEAFPGTYLKAADLRGRTVKVKIADCRMEHLDDETKPLLLFVGKDRGLILNKTNSGILVNSLGDETDLWRGQVIELYPDRVMFSGRMVDAIRVRVPAQPAAPAPEPPPPPPRPTPMPAAVDLDDDIPF